MELEAAIRRPRLFVAANDPQPVQEPIGSHWQMEVTATHCRILSDTLPEVPVELRAIAPTEDLRFPPIAWNAVEAAGSEWVDSIELAAAAGHPYSGHWRSVVAALVRAGYLERDPRTKKLRRGPREHTPTDGE